MESLVARIERFDQTYYISESCGRYTSVEDEALLVIATTVTCVSRRHRRFEGQPFDITLACSRSFTSDKAEATHSHPFLLPVSLRKDQRGCMAYLPADAFWALPPMIETGSITHVEIQFEALRYGSAPMTSLHFATEARLSD